MSDITGSAAKPLHALTENVAELDWDHVRVFLVTMRSSSLQQAAEELGLSHPTARRRLNALEEQLGLRLFDRRSDELHATEQAVELQHAAEEVETAIRSISRVAHASDPDLRGPVRVTAPDIIATSLLMSDFADFCERWPEIDLHVSAGYEIASLERREADVALRATPHGKMPDANIAGRLAGTAYKSVYGQGSCWIGWEGAKKDASWVRESPIPKLPICGEMNDPMLQRNACAAGMGLTMLPFFFAEPLLERRSAPIPAFDIWVLVHPDLKRNARLRISRDAIVEAIKKHGLRLAGE
ncbi:MAG: LysR family transcriptional regulator [Myxococcales bacterium]|nr:LysR family transcriptional regulator [Myxococcales bacterium]